MERSHAERLAHNEAFFRDLNEYIREAAGNRGTDGHLYEFICECADRTCLERVALTIAAYEEVRADPIRFVLAPGHDVAEIETVIDTLPDHLVVQKIGAASDVAAASDPRAA